jgi:phytoene dehydrogenase-like protein
MARIAVIGAGMGALAAAARLATGGHRVAVYERSATHGGGVGQYAREGFAFDTGPGLLRLPAVYRDLFVKTGKETLEQSIELVQVDPASRHLFADGTDVSLPNASRSGVTAALDAAFGAGAGERWSELLTRAREVWEATRRPLLEDALPPGSAPLGRDPYPARRGLFRRGEPTLASVAIRELRDPRLAALLESYALEYGYDPRRAPAAATVLPYIEQTFGTWYVRGGMRALADAVYGRCVARGVEFHFGTEAVRITEKNGRAAGAELADGRVAEADAVVAGVDPWQLNALLPGPPDPSRAPAPGPGMPGRLTLCLALCGARPAGTAHRTLVHPAERHGGEPTVTVLRPDDPALRPDESHEAVTVTATAAWHEVEGGADETAERLLRAAEAAVPGLRERILWREVRTPADTERETGAPGGAVPGPVLAGSGGAFRRPANRTPFPGLYLVGGWAHPGGGLAHAGMSGAITADLISGGPGGSR